MSNQVVSVQVRRVRTLIIIIWSILMQWHDKNTKETLISCITTQWTRVFFYLIIQCWFGYQKKNIEKLLKTKSFTHTRNSIKNHRIESIMSGNGQSTRCFNQELELHIMVNSSFFFDDDDLIWESEMMNWDSNSIEGNI